MATRVSLYYAAEGVQSCSLPSPCLHTFAPACSPSTVVLVTNAVQSSEFLSAQQQEALVAALLRGVAGAAAAAAIQQQQQQQQQQRGDS